MSDSKEKKNVQELKDPKTGLPSQRRLSTQELVEGWIGPPVTETSEETNNANPEMPTLSNRIPG